MRETLEEAAENESEYLADYEDKEAYQKAFIEGAEWQAERMYSEEDMKLAYKTGARLALISQSDLALCKGKFPTPDEWFNEFKKT
jgi:hypothetical protein